MTSTPQRLQGVHEGESIDQFTLLGCFKLNGYVIIAKGMVCVLSLSFGVHGHLIGGLVAEEAGVPTPAHVLHFANTSTSMGCSKSTDPALVKELQQINAELTDFKAATLATEARN